MSTVFLSFIFWIAGITLFYTFLGYPAWLWLRCRWRPCSVRRQKYQPFISIITVVRNEEKVLARKLANLLALDYPRDRYEIVIVSDGSTDKTASILEGYKHDDDMRVIINPGARGKAAGLNDAIALARGEVLVFTDARQLLALDSVTALLENFADPDVGCVSGDLALGGPSASGVSRGWGLYWGLEKKLWELESGSGSAVGVTGPFYAARRELLPLLAPETILDDVYIPMEIVRAGKRVLIDSRAKAWDATIFEPGQEYTRKVRTSGGNYQLLNLQPWLLTGANPIRFEFISHRLLKLAVPFILLAIFVASALLQSPFYRLALSVQLVFYALAAVGSLSSQQNRLARIAHSAFTFLLLNAAAMAAFANFALGRRVVWKR